MLKEFEVNLVSVLYQIQLFDHNPKKDVACLQPIELCTDNNLKQQLHYNLSSLSHNQMCLLSHLLFIITIKT